MKLKKIIAISCMLLGTLLGIMLVICSLSTYCFNANSLNSYFKSDKYISVVEENIEKELKGYVSEEYLNKITDKENIEKDITSLVKGFEKGGIEQANKEVATRIDKLSNDMDVNNVQNLSNKYTNAIFPSTKIATVSKLYSEYFNTIKTFMFVILIAWIICNAFIILNRSNAKYILVELYNILIVNMLMVILLVKFNSIALGGSIITYLFKAIRSQVLYGLSGISIVLIIACAILNIVLYKKQIKKSK